MDSQKIITAPFSDLALGTRFRYNPDHSEIFVKIDNNVIAEWDEALKTDKWIGQGIFSFAGIENLDTVVVVE